MNSCFYYLDPVETFWDADDMRHVRNQCRKFMTGDQKYISFFRQLLWWRKNKNNVKAWIVKTPSGARVGFGLVRGNTVTGGVVEIYRGKGIGRIIFETLTDEVPKPAYLEVFENNVPARKLYESLGWDYGYTHNGICYYAKD